MFRKLVSEGAALLVPPLCLACERPCDAGERVCRACRAAIAAQPRGCSPSHPALTETCAAFRYEGLVRRLITALKFEHAVAAAEELAVLMAPRLPLWMEPGGWLIPAPAHPARERRRGFNQSLLLARSLAEITGQLVVDCLVRDPSTRPQTELSRADRLALPREAVRVDQRALRQLCDRSLALFPTNVVVCDDVTTTGVTLGICASAIRDRHPGSADKAEIRAVTVASTSALTPGQRRLPTTRERHAG